MKGVLFTLAAAALLVGSAGKVRADGDSLLTNHGFETGDLTGWTDGGNLGWNSVVGGNAPDPEGGSFQISNGAVGSESLLSQTFATVPGGVYNVDFWIQNDGAGTFRVNFDGVDIYSEAFVGHPYAEHSVLATASTALTTITLASRDDPGFIQFDDIDVSLVSVPTPEPASLALAATGFVGAAGYIRRRRKLALA